MLLKKSYEDTKGVRLVRIAIDRSDLPADSQVYRIVQVSDLHLGIATSIEHLIQVFEMVRVLDPHLIVLTGDFIQLDRSGARGLFATDISQRLFRARKVREYSRLLRAALGSLNPPDGIVGILGNHDYQEGRHTIMRNLAPAVRWLINSSEMIETEQYQLSLIGLDDWAYGKPDLNQALEHREQIGARQLLSAKKPFTLILSHNPDLVVNEDPEMLKEAQLILCGHTHGGQICLPFGVPVVTRTKQRRFVRGLKQLSTDTHVYVNSGIGYGGLPLRLFCPPELTLIEI